MTHFRHIKYWTLAAVALLFLTGIAEAGDVLRTVLSVRNVSCSSCLRVIESEFRKTPGITGMAADLRKGIVVADHESGISSGEVSEIVSRLGYPAQVVSAVSIRSEEARVFRRLAGYGAGPEGCNRESGGCSPVADAWKELYRRFIRTEKK
ncbi:MAG: heavy-metal-associated domain-containing protein [Proteobacteria bacterium]|nr:heavy-metal-associated domain-containing protein [Pseudomonadota bacterium]MBU1739000.1 heavy-metal-associated domain-containing protein [Pseudomonadota bacterium]